MRSEAEMLRLIVETAREDDQIRAVIMNGSRANPNAPRDPFQDYDIVYLVKDVAPFWKNLEWIKRFGELMILQMPEDMQDPAPANDGSFIYLMQFTDGNRIDLSIYPVSGLETLGEDSQSIVLLDKDDLMEPLPPSSDSDYLPKPQSYSTAESEKMWEAFEAASTLFRTAGGFVAQEFGFEYPVEDDERVIAHMSYVRALPKDAVDLYPEGQG